MIITTFVIISTVLLGIIAFLVFLLLLGFCTGRFHKKPNPPIKDDCHNKKEVCKERNEQHCPSKNQKYFCNRRYEPKNEYRNHNNEKYFSNFKDLEDLNKF